MNLTTKEIAGLAVAAVVLILIAWGISLIPTPKVVILKSDTYINETYGYFFTYPSSLAVKEYTPEHVSVGIPGENDSFTPLVDITAVRGGEGEYDAFLFANAKLYCAADGPDESVDCDKVLDQQGITNSNGVPGTQLNLELVDRVLSTGEIKTAVFGPVYAFDLGSPADGGHAALLIYRPLPALFGTDTEHLKAVAGSLSFR